MKKFTVLILVGLLIMAFGCSKAYAQPKLEFQASGLITTTGLWYQNIPTGGSPTNIIGPWADPFRPTNPDTPPARDATLISSGAWNRPQAYLVNRMNLVFDASIGKELTGRLALEIDAMRWGTR